MWRRKFSRLELKDVECVDLKDRIDHWRPHDPYDVIVNLHLSIGEQGEEACYLYQYTVATPKGLERFASNFLLSDRSLIVVRRFDWRKVKAHIESIIAKCNSDSEAETQQRLSRYFLWEFEDSGLP